MPTVKYGEITRLVASGVSDPRVGRCPTWDMSAARQLPGAAHLSGRAAQPTRSMPTLDYDPGVCERVRELPFDAFRVGL